MSSTLQAPVIHRIPLKQLPTSAATYSRLTAYINSNYIVATGQVTISDTNTVATVTFPPTVSGTPVGQGQPDTNYQCLVTPSTFTGFPALGSARVMSVTKDTLSFTVTVETAPTNGYTQTFDWVTIRST